MQEEQKDLMTQMIDATMKNLDIAVEALCNKKPPIGERIVNYLCPDIQSAVMWVCVFGIVFFVLPFLMAII